MAEWCEVRTTAEALEELERAGVPAGPVLAPSQVFEDEHIRAMRFFREVAFPGRKEPVRVPDTPLRFSSIEAGLRDVAPRLGEHTDQILASLGYTGPQVEALRVRGVI
jgi:crotonobetainyl-CoA:carnitine CoA-transferase CaiB-like acyl-CoA transferase